jgi:hypothetical protein
MAVLRLALPVILPRAFALWALMRLLVGALVLSTGNSPLSEVPAPAATVIVIAGIIGMIDVRIRGERVLWANLGVPAAGVAAGYAAAAAAAELLLAILLQ